MARFSIKIHLISSFWPLKKLFMHTPQLDTLQPTFLPGTILVDGRLFHMLASSYPTLLYNKQARHPEVPPPSLSRGIVEGCGLLAKVHLDKPSR